MNRKDVTKPRPCRGTPWFKQVGENLFHSVASSSGCYANSGEIKQRPGLKRSEAGRSVSDKKVPKAGSTRGKKMPKAGSAPCNISRVHSGTDPGLVWRQLIKERQKTKMLQLEVGVLKKELELSQKSLKEKLSEIESKDKLINELMKKSESEDFVDEDVDIDNLLDANLGDVRFTYLLSLTDSTFPTDLIDLQLTNLDFMDKDSDQGELPSSMTMDINTAFIAEEPLLPNREESYQIDQDVKKKDVGRKGDQKTCSRSSENVDGQGHAIKPQNYKSRKVVSPIKITKEDNKYKLSKRRNLLVNSRSCPVGSSPSKKMKTSRDIPPAPQSLSCPLCSKKFLRGSQCKLTKHLSSSHNSDMAYSCQYCDKQFTCQSILTAHTVWHQLTNPWQCDECGGRFENMKQFIEHVKRNHQAVSLATVRSLLVSGRD